MKFDYCIGNPPYTSESENGLRSAKAIYPYFIIEVEHVADKLCLVTPSRWFNGNAKDSAYDDLRTFFKKHNHMKNITNFTDSTKIFPNNNISGAVSYFMYDKSYSGDVEFSNISSNEHSTDIRPLFEDDIDIILPRIEMCSILHKVLHHQFNSIGQIIRPDFSIIGQTKYTTQHNITQHVRCYLTNNKEAFLNKKDINSELVDKYYVFTSSANGNAGLLLEGKVDILGKIRICKPNEITGGGFTIFGLYDNEIEAIAVKKYLDSKFVRFLIGLLKASHRLSTNVYKFVPLQDFTPQSDINWTVSIQEIDNQLYKKYNLTDKEINFIDNNVSYIKY